MKNNSNSTGGEKPYNLQRPPVKMTDRLVKELAASKKKRGNNMFNLDSDVLSRVEIEFDKDLIIKKNSI
jgi:hypothetical protein